MYFHATFILLVHEVVALLVTRERGGGAMTMTGARSLCFAAHAVLSCAL